MNFQLDSAATCNMLAKSDFHLLGSPSLHDADTTLELYDGSFKRPLGWCKTEYQGAALEIQRHGHTKLQFVVTGYVRSIGSYTVS